MCQCRGCSPASARTLQRYPLDIQKHFSAACQGTPVKCRGLQVPLRTCSVLTDSAFSERISSMWQGEDMKAARESTCCTQQCKLAAQGSLRIWRSCKPQSHTPSSMTYSSSRGSSSNRGLRLMRPCARYVRRLCFCALLTCMWEIYMVSVSRPFTCRKCREAV